jgi:5-(carboxyamino)imidazole ribonucleotide synthase
MLKSKNKEDKPLTLGILGGGQLAKMLAGAAYRLGINIAIIEKGENSPAGDMTKLDFTKGWFDDEDLMRFAEASDVVTLENEFIDPEILDKVNRVRRVLPSPVTMRLVQDKFIQKETFQRAGIPVPEFIKIDSADDIVKAGEKFGYPFLIKTRTLGYDGYGNFTVKSEENCIEAWNNFNSGVNHRPLMAERFVNFTKELAVMVVRSETYGSKAYPCVETIQDNHICKVVIAPAEIDVKIRARAQYYAMQCVNAINGVGVFGVELFLAEDDSLMVNEIAPRPHNSGHYTIEACYTSQYENCIRAVCGLPLGSTEMIKPAACMINILGQRDGSGVPTDVTEMMKIDGAFLHLYNKKSSRKGRKMGHITALGDTQKEAFHTAKAATNALVW